MGTCSLLEWARRGRNTLRREHAAPPIFVFGAARSGTTLTYSLLLASGCFPTYAAESRILECASRYGSLRSGRKRERFLNDFFRSRQFLRSGLSEPATRALAELHSQSYVAFLDGFMAEITRAQGKRRWVEKSPNNTYFIDAIASYYTDARFVHVVRDGRSVAASQRQLGWGEKYSRSGRGQLIWIANVWDLQVRAGQRAARFGDRYLEIHYEDLVTNSTAVLDALGDFAGVEIKRAAVDRAEVGALRASNTAFTLEDGGISSGALERWRSVLEPDEIGLLNWQLGARLRELGYEVRDEPGSAGPTVGDRATAVLSRWALDGKRLLNLHTPLGRFARKPLEIGLS